MTMKFRASVALLSLAALSLSACGSTNSNSSGEEVTLKLAMVDNTTSNYYKGAQAIAEEVEKATDGKVKINVVAGGALGDERGTVEMAMNGDLDIATAANPVVTNWIPEMKILDQAFLWDNAQQAHAAVDGEVGKLIEEKAKGLGLHVLGYMESGFRNVFSKNPIEKIEDFKGVKIRTMQNEYHMGAFESFGAMPVAMPAGDQFTALQQGTIDAAENATSNMLVNKFYEVIKNHTTTNHAFVYILVMMSDKAWKKIPEDLREPVAKAIEQGAKRQREFLVEANEEAATKLKDLGVKFHEVDRASLKKKYEELAASKGWTFDPTWQSAVDSALQK